MDSKFKTLTYKYTSAIEENLGWTQSGIPLWVSFDLFQGQVAQTPEDIPDPSHGRVYSEMFHSVFVLKGF